MRIKASLRRLAGSNERDVIREASEATEHLDDAAQFVETVGLDQLEAAIEATDDPELEATGLQALQAFRRYRRAATGRTADTGADLTGDSDHFHRGHGTDLRRGDEPSRQ